MKMEIYSFYSPQKGKKERLREHVLSSLELIKEKGRIFDFGTSLNKNFYEIVKYSIIFHDFGKVFYNKYYFNENKELSFSGHEIISCWGANEYLKHMQENEMKDIDRRIVDLSVLLHHHPMNLSRRFKSLKDEYKIIDNEIFELFYDELEGIIERKEIDIGKKNVGEIFREVGGPGGLLKDLWIKIWMNSNPNIRMTFLLTTQILVAADYYSAHKVRGGSSQFINVVNNFIKFYMNRLEYV